MKNLRDNELVALIKLNNEDAFRELRKRIMPIAMEARKKYFIRNFETADWLQEAMIVFIETINLFDVSKGMSFRNFYMLRLRNQFNNMVRSRFAKARREDKYQISYELALSRELIIEIIDECEFIPKDEIFMQFIDSLSRIECAAVCAAMSLEYVSTYTTGQLLQANYRARRKMRNLFYV